MDTKQILNILKKYTNFELHWDFNENIQGIGAINHAKNCRETSNYHYNEYFYPEAKEKLESLPWTKVIKNPRSPKENDYPTEDGNYITMMDCNEHEVCTNTFKNGNFSWMNKTHIKWWMPISKEMYEMALPYYPTIQNT